MKVYIVAGEPSGDLLASGLMRALLRAYPDVEFAGVGGESMGAVGASQGRFRSLFDIAEISVMGIFEVLPRLPLIMRRIGQTVRDIERFEPDVLVTVDSWGFVSALLTRLRKKWRREASKASVKNNGSNTLSRSRQIPVVHYVAPQVWAWKKGRAKNVARLVDRLMTLLPDEGRWFEPHDLRCDFVGHPVVERIADASVDGAAFRAANGIPASATVVSVLPGSRHSEVKRLIPILKEAIKRIAVTHSPRTGKKVDGASKTGAGDVVTSEDQGVFVVVPTVAGVEAEVRRGFEDLGLPVCVVTGEMERYNAFSISKLALAKSGTVSLELAAFGVPHMIVYTFSRLTNLAAKMLVKVRFANLINLLADREIIPEFVLSRCRPELIAECGTELLSSAELARKQANEVRQVMQCLRLPDILPSERAAQIVAEMAQLSSAPRIPAAAGEREAGTGRAENRKEEVGTVKGNGRQKAKSTQPLAERKNSAAQQMK
jgi:lipid-A-disaccharide synthase